MNGEWKCPHLSPGCGWHGPEGFVPEHCAADRYGWDLLTRLRETMKPRMAKPQALAKSDIQVNPWQDATFEKDWPYLSAFLKDTTWDDGTLRETGTMLIFVQEGYLKCCLNDRACNRSCFLTAPTIDCLFDLAESGLEKGLLEWRNKKG